MAGQSLTPSGQGAQGGGLSWGHILNTISGGLFGGGHKEDQVEKHQREEDQQLHDIGMETPGHRDATGAGEPHAQITHPALKNIMAQLSEKDEEAPMGGGKGRYMGKKG